VEQQIDGAVKVRSSFTLLFLVFLSGCAGTGYNDWTEKEQTKYKYFLGLQAVDTLQTYKGLKCTSDTPLSECLEEANPLYGKSPSLERLVGVKLLSNLLIYGALRVESDVLSRETALNLMNIGITIVVINNQIVINKAF
jgi:hypothetical protein